MEKYEINLNMNRFTQSINDLAQACNIEKLKEEVQNLDELINSSDFWNDTKKAQSIIAKFNTLKGKAKDYAELEDRLKDLKGLIELYDEEETDELNQMIEEEMNTLDQKINKFEISVILSNPYDSKNCILEIHPGAGGTESQDWADMLYRMYLRYAQKKNFKVEVLDYQAGDEAGIKSVTILIKGLNAYGLLKSEAGVHRLVRISPFDSNARRHTSFASVEVMPQFDDTFEIEVKDEDIRVDVYRSSGAGGQSVNRTDSAVRMTHIPTNIVVTCQNERSQIKNREQALVILKSRLLELEMKKKQAEIDKLKGVQSDISFGSQIRSYIFHPYTLVKDHRTNAEVGNINAVMDGDIDIFISTYLKKMAANN